MWILSDRFVTQVIRYKLNLKILELVKKLIFFKQSFFSKSFLISFIQINLENNFSQKLNINFYFNVSSFSFFCLIYFIYLFVCFLIIRHITYKKTINEIASHVDILASRQDKIRCRRIFYLHFSFYFIERKDLLAKFAL